MKQIAIKHSGGAGGSLPQFRGIEDILLPKQESWSHSSHLTKMRLDFLQLKTDQMDGDDFPVRQVDAGGFAEVLAGQVDRFAGTGFSAGAGKFAAPGRRKLYLRPSFADGAFRGNGSLSFHIPA